MPDSLIEIEDARRLVLAEASRLESEVVALRESLGRVLAESVISPEDVPGFDNSAMDGFALRAADTVGSAAAGPVALRITGESRAGAPADAQLGAGEAFRISTGAMVPAGADTVVRVEDTRVEGDRVLLVDEAATGANIRRSGEDIRLGETVLAEGSLLGPSELGVLASVGRVEAGCVKRPRLSVLSTGDELLDPAQPMRPGGVRNSNAYTVPGLAALAGAEVVSVERVGDDREATIAALEAMLEADVSVICGGVSVGEHDHVRPALTALGAEEVFWGVALRPGKPTWFGTYVNGDAGPRGRRKLVFGLPGNPVSVVVTFLLFVRPALRALVGAGETRERTTAVLTRPYEKRPGRAHLVRCTLRLGDAGFEATPTGHQGSHVLTSMLGADAFAIFPTEAGSAEAGDRVEVELLPRSL